jgi:cAMP-dependent protein kinase regulator
VMCYKKGQYFGERALLTNDMRAASIVVTSEECIVLTLQRDTFTRLMGKLEDILRRNMEEYQKIMEVK